MAYLRDGYGNAAGLPTSDPQQFNAEVCRLRDSLLPHSNSRRHLLLMHGTDHQEPPVDTSTAIAAAQGHLDGDKLVHSTLAEYLAAVQVSLKREPPHRARRIAGLQALTPVTRGLSARMWIKQRNRASETAA